MSRKTTREAQTFGYRIELFTALSTTVLKSKSLRQSGLRIVDSSVPGRTMIRYRVDNSGIR
jgi:hypothetical protein